MAYSLAEIRAFPQGFARDYEIVQLPSRARWMFVPDSLEPDDGADWLLPDWQDVTARGRWGKWQIETGGGGGESSPLAVKGDLHTFDSDNARLPVGADGYVLTADSGEATGLKWEAGGSYSPPIPQSDVSGLVAALAAKEATANKGAASGYASLDGSTKVVEDPANAQTTPAASKIPKADGSGKLAAGWGGSASTLATLNGSAKVVEDPANATATPTASKIVIADGSALVDGWVSDATTGVKGKVKLANCLGGTAALPDVIAIKETGGPTVLVIGAIADGKYGKRSGSTFIGGDPPMFELIENKEIGTHVTSYDFSTGIDGDTDEEYYVVYRFVKDASGAQSCYLRPNAVTTNQRNRARYVGSSEGTLNDTAGGILLSNNGGAAGDVDTGVIWIHADKAKIRTAESSWTQAASGGDCFRIMVGWIWNETSTNITSWRWISTATNGIGVGSYMRIYRVRHAA